MDEEKIKKLKEIIDESSNIVFMGGAGVSTESGIPDFRSGNGIYGGTFKGLSPEEILSDTFFFSRTSDFYDFYKNQMIYKDAKPNKAHIALRKLEEQGKLKAVITQNIDGLHSFAGSKEVIELHGTTYKNTCIRCGKKFDLKYVMESKDIPKCDKCGGLIKPDVVLYGEGLNMGDINKAVNYIENANVLIVGGTSLIVNPAASLVTYFGGKHFIIINKSETPYDRYATLIIRDAIGEVLDRVVE